VRDLRQLDDWVFDLSGEAAERRQSLRFGGRHGGQAIGAVQPKTGHPSPHKGVLVFNGPTTEALSARERRAFEPRTAALVESRCLCVILVQDLNSWLAKLNSGNAAAPADLWSEIHSTNGLLASP